MSSVAITGNAAGAGVFTIASPNSASSFTATLPAATTTLVGTDATQTLTNKTIEGGAITSGTVVSVSGTTVDFTSIPSWVKRITIAMQSISTSGSSSYILRIGNTTFTTTGYVSVMNYVAITANSSTGDTSTTGFLLTKDGSSSFAFTALATIVLQSSGFYICTFTGMNSAGPGFFGTGHLNLGSVLDRVRLTTVNGTDTFDAGSINILYEG